MSAIVRPDHRPQRVLLILAVVWVFGCFDLAYTQSNLMRGNFIELNPLAALVAEHAAGGLATFKLTLLALGSGLLYRLRQKWSAEAGTWLLLGLHGGLMVWWSMYHDAVAICVNDPTVNASTFSY
ncbi:hypothetical protein RAS1_06250 [Phycisphaerae bacterium RAS1]|nr:hypothetical protein RAS1_06250 [Phycisphaerae bacterium RAS1]